MSSSSSTVIITMKLSVLTTPPSSFPLIPKTNTCPFPNYTHNLFNSPKSTFSKPSKIASVSSQHTILDTNIKPQNDIGNKEYNIVSIGTQIAPAFVSLPKWNMSDQASFLLTFIVCTTSVSFTSLVFAAVPTITAMGRAALSLSKLADTAREELPSTMAAVRLSGMEISDLTLELSDLSHEIADGVGKSAQAVQAAEAGVRQIGSHARQQTISMIQERANLPPISIQPVLAGAAKKTSRAVSQAAKSFVNLITQEKNTGGDGNTVNRIDT
ncbi:hypothetical protein Leryth_027107 [Lithospermum erythrorhizon]|nr:hypothetical protein Leryth_027107 [Lithospermum erythrorhizon]